MSLSSVGGMRVPVPYRLVGLMPTLLSLSVLSVTGILSTAMLLENAFPSQAWVWIGLVLIAASAFAMSLRPRAWFEDGHFVVRSYFRTRRFDLADWSLSREPYMGAWFTWTDANWIGLYQVAAYSDKTGRSTSIPATMTTRKGADHLIALADEMTPPEEQQMQ